jgi:hypothetical protein
MAAFAMVAFAALIAASPAEAGFQPQNLHVAEGEGWHADPAFELRWSNPAGVKAVHYRVLAPSGEPTGQEGSLGWPATAIEHLNVPGVPGTYVAEVWLERTDGELGPPASASLRFDDAPPGQIQPPSPLTWIGRDALPLTVSLGRPVGPDPISGIRGYAIAIDRDPAGEPCATAERCSEAETDLHGGAGDDAVQLAGLPEGTSYLHAVAVSGSGVRSASVATLPLRFDATDPVTALYGAPAGWSKRPVTLRARATDSASGMVATGDGDAPLTAIWSDGGAPVTAPGDSVETTLIGSGVHTIAYYARDAAGNAADGALVNGQRNAPAASAVVKIDRDPPAVDFSAAQDPKDPELIEASVADPLSGFDPSRGEIAVRPAGSGQRFAALPTAGRGSALRARWDSSSYPPGPYEFRATAYDLAGNATSSVLRSNGSQMLLRAPLKTIATLTAGFGHSGATYVPMDGKSRTGSRLTVGFGHGATFAGRLIAGRRTPLAGRSVRVVEHFDPGAGLDQRVSIVRTGRDGGFAVRLAPGPSREVLATAAPTSVLAAARSQPAHLDVRGFLSLHASAPVAEVGGRPIVFAGRVAAAPPRSGKTVQLQFRLPGLPWREFRTVTADACGRFRYSYRFADDDSRGARFQFRALAPRQAGWPYLAAGSRSVTVRGR